MLPFKISLSRHHFAFFPKKLFHSPHQSQPQTITARLINLYSPLLSEIFQSQPQLSNSNIHHHVSRKLSQIGQHRALYLIEFVFARKFHVF